MKFKTWILAEDLQSQKDTELQRIWADTFKALGVGGLSDEDAAQQSLSKITFGQRSPDRAQTSTFKGKQAVSKRLENGQIFSRLEKLNNPDLNKNIEDTRHWLKQHDPKQGENASTTISMLMQRLFGQENFQKFIDQDFPKVDQAIAKVQPQPPKQGAPGNETPAPDNSMDQGTPQPQPGQPPQGGMMGQQPQAPGNMQPPAPSNGMPPKPAGAEMGLF
jgi:hypothetical protein